LKGGKEKKEKPPVGPPRGLFIPQEGWETPLRKGKGGGILRGQTREFPLIRSLSRKVKNVTALRVLRKKKKKRKTANGREGRTPIHRGVLISRWKEKKEKNLFPFPVDRKRESWSVNDSNTRILPKKKKEEEGGGNLKGTGKEKKRRDLLPWKFLARAGLPRRPVR